MKLEKLVEALEESQVEGAMYPIKGCVWYRTEDNFVINTDSCKQSLIEGEGNTYSYDYSNCEESEDGYVVFYDADCSMGYNDTIIMKLSEEITYLGDNYNE